MSDQSNSTSNDSSSEGANDGNLDQLRKKAAKSDVLDSQNQELQKELAFVKSGLNVDEGVGKLFFDSYDGEMTVEAVQAKAQEYGLGATQTNDESGDQQQQQQDPTTTLTPEQQAEQQFFQQAGDGAGGNAGAGDGSDQDPFQRSYEVFTQARKEGRTQEDAGQEAMAVIFKAASEGDTRAILDEEAWRAANA